MRQYEAGLIANLTNQSVEYDESAYSVVSFVSEGRISDRSFDS